MTRTSSLRALMQRLTEQPTFQSVILTLILLNAVVMGLDALPVWQDYADWWFALLWLSQLVFSVELLIRIGAYGRDWRGFFAEGWNRFDFVVIVLAWLPAVGGLSLVARLLRLLRLLRLVSGSASMRAVVSGRALEQGALASRLLLLVLLLYMLTLAGYYLFANSLPQHWGDLLRAASSIGQLLIWQDALPIVRALQQHSVFSLLFAALPLLCVGSVCYHGYRAWSAGRAGTSS